MWGGKILLVVIGKKTSGVPKLGSDAITGARRFSDTASAWVN